MKIFNAASLFLLALGFLLAVPSANAEEDFYLGIGSDRNIGKASFAAARETTFSAAVNQQNQVVLGTSLGRLHVFSLTLSVQLLKSQSDAHPNTRVKAVFWTNDQELVSIGDGGNLKRWNLNTNELRTAFANESKDLFNVKIVQGHHDSAEASSSLPVAKSRILPSQT